MRPQTSIRRAVRKAVLMLVAVSACGVIERAPEPPPLTVAEAAERQAVHSLVRGALLERASGEVRLCEMLSDSTPPTCEGTSLLVPEYDVLPSQWRGAEEAGDARWLDDTTLFGTVDGGTFKPEGIY